MIVEFGFSPWSFQLQGSRSLTVKILWNILVVFFSHLPTTAWVHGSAALGCYGATERMLDMPLEFQSPFNKYILMYHFIPFLKSQQTL